jgi:gluconokinase
MAKVGGLVYFGRMLDKIRVHADGKLPEDYQPNLGKGFDRSCVGFLGIEYHELAERAKEGGTDEQILDWCFAKARKPGAGEMHVWNEYMRKRGWNDEISETLTRRKREGGMAERSEIETMFQFIDADEGRL